MANDRSASKHSKTPEGRQVRIFVSSPGDVRQGLREAVLAAVEEVNEGLLRDRQLYLRAYFYEDYAPAVVGEAPQETVNRYMMVPGQADIFLCVFGRRMGTPHFDGRTKRQYQSGTHYEFEEARRAYRLRRAGGRRPLIWLYRWDIPAPSSPTEETQRQEAMVTAFFAHVSQAIPAMHATIPGTVEELRQKILKDLSSTLQTDDFTTPDWAMTGWRWTMHRLGLVKGFEGKTRRSLEELTKRVEGIWLHDFLENTPEWHGLLQIAVEWEGVARRHLDLLHIYDEVEGQLLILGAQGSGKTFMMLDLMQSLIERQRARKGNPSFSGTEAFPKRPVVFNLSSWARTQGSLEEWMISELVSPLYRVPARYAREWVNNGRLILFLDGLDEIMVDVGDEMSEARRQTKEREENEARTRCVHAINLFLKRHPGAKIVVTCQREPYQCLKEQLHFKRQNACVFLEPLGLDEVDRYLENDGEFTVLREALQNDGLLAEMAQVPYLLNTMTVAYRDNGVLNVRQLTGLNGREEKLRHLFDEYVEKRVVEPESPSGEPAGGRRRYTLRQVREGLSQLAEVMSKEGQKAFFLECMQPAAWLRQRELWRYAVLAGGLLGLFVAAVVSIPSGLAIATEWSWDRPWQTGVGNGIVCALVTAGVCFFMISLGFIWARNWCFGAIVGLALGVVRGCVVSMGKIDGGWLQGIKAFGMTSLFSVVSLGVLFKVTEYRRDTIRPLEALNWNWQRAAGGALAGLLFGSAFWLVFDAGRGISFGLAVGITLMFAFGLQGSGISVRCQPNQGIYDSLATATVAGIALGLAGPVFFGISYGWQYHGRSAEFAEVANIGMQQAVVNGILGICLSVAAIALGVIPVAKHSGLRLALLTTGRLPFALGSFLEEARKVFLLKRMGGGYVFMHRSLQEYFKPTDG